MKTLWYQLRLVRALAIGVAPLVGELDRLETELGNDHNLVILEATLRGCRDLPSMRRNMRQVGDLQSGCVSRSDGGRSRSAGESMPGSRPHSSVGFARCSNRPALGGPPRDLAPDLPPSSALLSLLSQSFRGFL